ncbi:HNH endonuclease [Macrococcus sp. EM39E]|uniref:HNH endonuclease n=1 Tax=Macrococcus animalis TaxID=3395467 RepID=UPI0039BDCD8B
MLYNICSHPRCSEEIEKPLKYCDKHKNDKSSNAYNRTRYDNNKEYIKFYNSGHWKRKRKQVLRRDDYICQSCKAKGLIKVADVVDHIIPTKVDWDKRLHLNNLQCLCNECHNIKTKEDKIKYGI